MADITVDEFSVYLKNRKEASGLNLSGLDLSNIADSGPQFTRGQP